MSLKYNGSPFGFCLLETYALARVSLKQSKAKHAPPVLRETTGTGSKVPGLQQGSKQLFAEAITGGV